MRCSPNRQQRGLLSGGGSAFYLSLSKDHLLVPTLRQRGLHGDNLVASGLQFSAAIIALYILRMPGNSICQTIEGKVTARNKMSQNALALADVELLGRKLNYLGSCRRENGSFLGIPEFLHQRIEPGFIDRCPDGVLNLHQECPVFSFDGLIPENPEITIHAFVDAANVAFANAHIRHHAIGADKPVNQRLHGHAAHADLRIGNQDAGLNNVPRHYLGLDALVDNLDVHTGIGQFTAFNAGTLHFRDNRQDLLGDLVIVDAAVTVGENGAGGAIKGANHAAGVRGLLEPAIDVCHQQAGVLCPHPLVVGRRDFQLQSQLTVSILIQLEWGVANHEVKVLVDGGHLHSTRRGNVVLFDLGLPIKFNRQFLQTSSMKMQRSAGILLPISSLPSPYGIGCFSQEAYDFVDWLKEAGQTYWQILPLGVTSYGDSPYQSFSAFAGNPYFISLDELVKEGVLTAEECKKAKFGRKADDIDYSQLYKERGRLLRLAYSRSDIGHNEAFAAFCEKNKWWLDDFALFMAVKGRFDGKPWIEWAEDIRLRWQNAMDYYRRELYFEVEYYKYLQFKFDQQWHALKAYANEKGIRIIGDIPIYVALDSADAWANPQMFQLDEDNIPTAVAGVPPDGFSPTGQLWGNPLYRWEKHRETGYQWWITRLWYCFELYDVVRIDHFRGFDEYFSIPYGSETAAPGHWEKGPGIELFRAVEQALGKREIIAEDLGYMSETVRQLVQDSGFPGMKVLEFAFDSRDTGSASDYLPHNYPVNSVAYTGTHDNETLVSWYQTITSAERTLVRDYLYDYTTPEPQLYKSMIALIFRSAAATCIIPMQDWLGLDNYDRINKPSTVGENWRWRLKKSQLTPKLQKEICSITTRYGRMNWA